MGLETIQNNLIIKMPRLGFSFEVNATPVENKAREYVVYSLSSSKDKQISFRRNYLVLKVNKFLSRGDASAKDYPEVPELVYTGDSVISNGSWMKEHKRGARIC